MAELEKLTSTVEGITPEAQTAIETAAQAASSDGLLQEAELQGSLAAFLASLQASSVVEGGDTISQLASESPAIDSFVQALQQAIAEAKAASPQGLLLAQNLQLGIITQTQFSSSVQAITLSSAQLQAAVSAVLPSQTQNLLLALASSNNLNTLAKIISNAQVKVAQATAHAQDTANPKTPPSVAKLAANAQIIDPTSTKLETPFKDENLSFLQNLFLTAKRIAEQNLRASASSLLSLNPQPRIMTGARAVVRLNNKTIALCNNVSYEVSTDWQEIRGVDELLPNDLSPTNFSVKGTMSIYRVPNKSPVGDFLQQDMFRGMIWPYTTIEIRDKRTDELIMLVKRAAITSRSEAFTKNQLTSTNLSFVGIGFRDESIPELMPDELTGEDDGTGGLLDTFKAISNKIF